MAQSTQDLTELYISDNDTPKPEVNKKHVRLYGHHLCPYVEKVRLALAAKNITYQNVEIDLGKKNQWHIDINGGLVPIIELPDGTIIIESKVLMIFAEEYSNEGYSLLPGNAVEKAKIRLLQAQLSDSLNGPYFGAYMNRFSDDTQLKELKDRLQRIEDILKKQAVDTPYFFNTQNPTLVDIDLYPLISRVEFLKGSIHDDYAKKINFTEDYPKLQAFLNAIRSRPEFQKALSKERPFQNYLVDLSKLEKGQRLQLYLPVKY